MEYETKWLIKILNNLLREFVEEELRETGNARVFVDDTGRQLADLTFDLDHIVENEVR